MSDADRLAAAFEGGRTLDALSAPLTMEAAYDLQDAVRARLARPVVGWKLAQVPEAVQAAAGITAPTVSPLLSGMIVPDETRFGTGRFRRPEVEAEIVLEIGSAITEPVAIDDLQEQVLSVRLGLEIADTRFTDKLAQPVTSVVADMNSCGALVVTPPVDPSALHEADAIPVSLRLGDGALLDALPQAMRPRPLIALSFLVDFVLARGETIAAGALITTGTHTKPTVSGPGLLAGSFDDVGKVSARLSSPMPVA
ncbi:MAG: fumarylacetoacetate hydrolase family protein [Pseudomonadota bacterium]